MKVLFTFIFSLTYQLLPFVAPVHSKIDDRQAAINTLREALADSEYNLTDADGDIGELATRLFGWQGCGGWGSSKRKAIYSGWEQSWKMMDAVQGKSLNWNEAAAVEYLAPPFVNQEERAAIKNIIDTVVTVRGGSNLNPLKWWLHVRCDDPDGKCPCNPGSGALMAYTTNRDSGSGYARINFCPAYFELPNLYQVVKDNSNKELPIEHRANLNNYYKNKGRVWFHELLHIDWASGVDSPYHITDLICILTDQDGVPFDLPIYGPQLTKGLAKFKLGAAWWLKRNADNFAMYAMAKTAQKATGNYPHLPLAVTLKGVQDNPDLFMTGNIIIDREGRTTMVGPKDQGECQAPGDEDGPGDKDNVVPFNSSAWFMDESYYPEDYNRQVRGWLADANPRHNRVRIVLMQTAAGPQWIVVQDTPEDPIKDFCLAEILSKAPANGDENNLEFPTKLPAFEAHGAKGCVYSGTSNIVGSLACEGGPSDVRCWEDPEWREMSYCDGGKYMLGIKCDWA
ncbi:uncharacterized protein FMAN_08779 [Fusarium mangiferae]|uniref:Uncharacterized protein n=1 Tax=Fusarium mangiferae TaxID=192010 RepID=A0A1L7T505_FUSMA|nr:uncharacterized protein FMAN_08779 [Fusarium mangiferae]CVK90377.1 uncharacterized protein FMAN_08779 [Fusarium mangiferae]